MGRGRVQVHDLLPGQSCRLVGRAGIGWVTIAGDPVDYVLEPLAILQFRGPGRIVIEAVGEEWLQFELTLNPPPDGPHREEVPA